MPYPLNNVPTADNYTDAATLTPQAPTRKVNITVANNAAMVQMERIDPAVKVGGGQFMDEEMWLPAQYSITREFDIGRIRFRSAAPGIPARIIANVA